MVRANIKHRQLLADEQKTLPEKPDRPSSSYLTQYVWRSTKKITRHGKRQEQLQFEKTKQASEPDSDATECGLIRQGIFYVYREKVDM